MPQADSIISIAGVTKRFGPVSAVDNISFDIHRGEFFSLLGSSGCGKTTLLRMLAGFEQPTEGEVFIDGEPMAGVPANHRPTNMVFQSYAIFPHLNVQENIGYGLRNAGITRDEAGKRVKDALALVKLAGLGERGAHQLSGGQRQRVALARALVCRPKVLLLDEPLGALDKNLREEMQIELRALQRTVGITFVFVTHDQEEALTLSDRIAVMSKGRVLQIAGPEELYEMPNCREVAEFIGTMNVFSGRILTSANGATTIDARALGKLKVLGTGRKGDYMFLALRPEKLRLAAKKSAASLNQIAGVVNAISYRGDRHHFLVTVEGHDRPISVSQQNDGDTKSAPLKVGAKVWINWPTSTGRMLSN
ncbi:MAG: ABC transporter ATP-binding protein [Aestuariivirga sp.]